MGVGASHGVQGVHAHPKLTRGEKLMDAIEIKQRFHQFGIVCHRVNDLNGECTELKRTQFVQIDIGSIQNFVLVNHLASSKDCLSHLLRGGTSITNVVFNTKVFVRPSGVMAGRKDNAAKSLV